MPRLTVSCTAVVLAVSVLTIPTVAGAAEVTEILDAFAADPNDGGVALALSLDWGWQSRQGTLTREVPCLSAETVGGTSLCPEGNRVLLVDELDVERVVTTLDLGVTFGFVKRLAIGVVLPVQLRDETALSYAAGVGPSNSTTDPLDGQSLFDVPYTGPSRGGLGDLRLWLRGAPLSGALDPGGVSWTFGAALTVPTASARRATNEAAGDGVWSVGFDTAVSARVWDVFEPFARLDLAVRLPAEDDGPFADQGATQITPGPQHSIGLTMGTDLVPFERPSLSSAVRLTLGARLAWVFAGRGYSDLFEALGSSPCDPQATPPCELTRFSRGDLDPSSGLPRTTDGVTNIEGHAQIGGWLGVRYDVLEALTLSARASITHETDHWITAAEPGVDLDGANDVEALNSAGQNELSPTWNAAYDTVGRRYRTLDMLIFAIDLGIQGKF